MVSKLIIPGKENNPDRPDFLKVLQHLANMAAARGFDRYLIYPGEKPVKYDRKVHDPQLMRGIEFLSDRAKEMTRKERMKLRSIILALEEQERCGLIIVKEMDEAFKNQLKQKEREHNG